MLYSADRQIMKPSINQKTTILHSLSTTIHKTYYLNLINEFFHENPG
jgi:hypothetical protein